METQELTTKAQEVISKSGIELELDITELHNLAEQSKTITSVSDENFKEVKKSLANKRKEISEGFMDARREFNRMSKGVIEVQNTLLDIFRPEENRLLALDKEEKARLIKEARLESLPRRKERIAAIGGEVILPEEWMGTFDEYLLEMEDADFEIYVVQRQGEKNEADRLALAAQKEEMEAKAKAAQDALDAQKAQADAIEAARVHERELAAENLRLSEQRLEDERKAAAARVAQDAADKVAAEEKLVKDKEHEAARKVQAEADAEAARVQAEEEKAANVEYQAWLLEIGWTEENKSSFKFITIGEGDNQTVEAYKAVGIYKKTYAKN
jgi:hypothetical protein